VTFADKEHHEYLGNYHDLYVDIDYQEVFGDFQRWLMGHLKTPVGCEPTELCFNVFQNYI
jgi:alpha-beta hydrolase superfamily lysophospholipase